MITSVTLHRTSNFIFFKSTKRGFHENKEQELSYHKQIARQLRTQFVEGIYRSDYA